MAPTRAGASAFPMAMLALALPLALFLVLWATLYFALAGLESGFKAMAQRAAWRVLRTRLAGWSAAHPGLTGLRSYAPMLLVLVLGVLAAFGAGETFVELAEHFRLTTSAVYHADRAVNGWMQHERFPGLTVLLQTVTAAAGPVGMAILVLAVAAGLLIGGHRGPALFIIAAGAGGALLNLGLKMIFERVRPPTATAIAAALGYSFPSGHAMGSFVVFGAIAYLVMRQPFRWTLKSACLALLVTAVVFVGLSRVYLGVHWISDIAGGWSAGAVWLASVIVAFETFHRLRQLHGGAVVSH